MITTYTIDAKKLEENYNLFCKWGDVYFPVKTNHNKLILNKLKKLGCGFECDSISHISKVYSKKGANKIMYSNVAKSYDDILWAIKHNISFYTIDDDKTLATIISLSKKYKVKKLKINVRINVFDIFREEFISKNVVDSRLGASVKTCKHLLNIINSEKEIAIKKGISFYVQAEIHNNEDILKTVFEYLTNNFSLLDKLDWINIGGGSSISRLNKSNESMKAHMRVLGIDKIILEPGRYLVDEVEDVYIPVKRMVDSDLNGGETIVSLDIGIYHGLIDIILHKRKFNIGYIKEDNFIKLNEYNSGKKLVIRGPTADSLDVIGIFNMPDDLVNKDTVFVIKNIGAYFEVTRSRFSGEVPVRFVLK